ncbi:hypothetical protein PENTCL1PPCAC_15198, partial [Pristionchus entomophagus]
PFPNSQTASIILCVSPQQRSRRHGHCYCECTGNRESGRKPRRRIDNVRVPRSMFAHQRDYLSTVPCFACQPRAALDGRAPSLVRLPSLRARPSFPRSSAAITHSDLAAVHAVNDDHRAVDGEFHIEKY